MINSPSKKSLKIMIVTGDKQSTDVLSKKLITAGYPDAHVVFYKDYNVANINEIAPEIVLVDHDESSEYDSAQTVQSITQEYKIPVIYISDSPDKPPPNISGLLIKPVDTRLLSSTIKIALSHHKSEKDTSGDKQLLDSIVGSIPFPFYIIDADDYTIKFAGPATSKEPLPKGTTCHQLTHHQPQPCNSREHSCPLKEVKRTKQPAMVEHLHYDRDGRERICEVHCYPILDDTGKVVSAIEYSLDITQRREAEEAQNRSEEDYRRIIENTDEAICIVQDDKLKSFNPGLIELLGYPEQEVSGRALVDFVHTDDKKYLAHNKISGNGKNIFDFRIIDKKNNVKWVRMTSIRIEWQSKTAFLNFLIDNTEIHKAQEKLEQSEERFRLFSELSYEGIAIFEDGIILDANESFGKLFGFNFADVLGMNIEDLFQSESRDTLQTAILPDGDRLLETVGKKKDGSTFVGEMAIEPVFYKGRNCRFVSIRNITDRLMAESDRLESENRLQKMLDTVQTGILLIDPRAHIIVDTNVAMAKMIGLPKNEIIGKASQGFICNAQNGQCLDADYDRSANNLERELIRSDKTIIPVLKSAVSVKLAGEEYFLESFLDISELKKSEEQQRQLQEKLIRSEKMESIGLLAGGVAHDLNNIITPLVAYPDMILSKLPEDSPVRKHVIRLGRSAQDAADVVQDLLMMARRGRYIMKPTCLNDVLEDYLDSPGFIQLTEENPGIVVKKEKNDDIPPINGSKVHLLKVIMNLIINAFDAMSEGGQLTIRTSCEWCEKLKDSDTKIEPGEYIKLTIKDTGIGIAKENIHKIFEPYYSNKTIGRSGSGLGLAVIYGILKDHKGFYDITSEVGKGTKFDLYFPILKTESNDRKKLPQDKNKLDEFRGNETVLVVDDCEEHQLIAGALLSMMGYKVETVANGREALKYLKKTPVDILLLDMVLEDSFDALDTYVEIKKIYPDQKAVILSGYSINERVEKLQKLGAGQFVRKPFSRRDLATAIRGELDNDRIKTAALPTP